jgi:transcriptional regulator with XRE-family HTH domain
MLSIEYTRYYQVSIPIIAHILFFMAKICSEIENLRKILSTNMKKWRKTQGLSQEKLAEEAGLSSNMVNDIEGGRTWVSDKTIIKLAQALRVEVYQLFVPTIEVKPGGSTLYSPEILLKLKQNIDLQFDEVLKFGALIDNPRFLTGHEEESGE